VSLLSLLFGLVTLASFWGSDAETGLVALIKPDLAVVLKLDDSESLGLSFSLEMSEVEPLVNTDFGVNLSLVESDNELTRAPVKAGFEVIKATNPVSASEPKKDANVTKPNNKDNKDTKNSDKKTDSKTEEKSQISAASLAKSFESSLKSTSTGAGRNVSLDTPRGWKSNSSKKKNEVKIEIIEKTDTTKAEETSKTSRTPDYLDKTTLISLLY
jgi:hypothetical protein